MAVPITPPAAAATFLTDAGWGGADILPLAGDASFRRYFRVVATGRQAVLMDAPPPHEDPAPFLAIAHYLRDLGFAAPGVLASDLRNGLVLLEDFGDARMREVLEAAPERERTLYAEMVALLSELHRHPPATLPPYSRAELQREVGLFVEWYCPAVGLDVDLAGYHSAWDIVFDRIEEAPPVTVLRDYHAENIMIVPNGTGHITLGLLDFQDALVGHAAYDLVSLLQDARRDVDPLIEIEMLARYAAESGGGPAFDNAYSILGGQRNTKILGIFTRLWKRDSKPRYLSLLPRVWGYLERDLRQPALAEISEWFALNIPQSLRATYWDTPRA